MVSKAKLYSKLDTLEEELIKRLVPHLEHAAKGNNDLVFCTKSFNPFRELKSKTDQETQELIDIGAQILALREKLGEPTDNTPAARICWYCREWGNQRHSAVSLAKQFLSEI